MKITTGLDYGWQRFIKVTWENSRLFGDNVWKLWWGSNSALVSWNEKNFIGVTTQFSSHSHREWKPWPRTQWSAPVGAPPTRHRTCFLWFVNFAWDFAPPEDPLCPCGHALSTHSGTWCTRKCSDSTCECFPYARGHNPVCKCGHAMSDHGGDHNRFHCSHCKCDLFVTRLKTDE